MLQKSAVSDTCYVLRNLIYVSPVVLLMTWVAFFFRIEDL